MPWSWPAGTRVLLSGLVIVAGLVLGAASWDVARESEPIGQAPELVLDPNTAPPQALAALPHVGPVLANRIVEARTERPFASLDDIRHRVRGAGPVTLARIQPYLLPIERKPGVRPEDRASSHGAQLVGKPRGSRSKATRARRPASTPRPVAQPQGSDARLDFAVAHRE